MSTSIVSFLEKNSLLVDDQVTAVIANATVVEQQKLRDEFKVALGPLPPSRNATPFTFLASSSFRGERCCRAADCRVESIDRAARFGALYADKLYIPISAGENENDEELLEGAIRVVAKLRPLIDAGIVTPVPVAPQMCPNCAGEFKPVLEQALTNVKALTAKYANDFSVKASIYRSARGELFGYEVRGPDELLADAARHFLFHKIPNWAVNLQDGEGITLSRSQIKKGKIVESLFSASVRDFVLQSVTGSSLGTTYLTSQAGEAEFFATSSCDFERLLKRTQALARVAHQLPTFETLSLGEILELRHRETPAFQNYRNAMTDIILRSEKELDNPGIFDDLFDDVLRPQIEELETKDIEEKRRRRTNLLGRGGLGVFGAVFGSLISGVHPVLGAAIGAGVLCIDKTAADDLTGSLQSAPSVRAHSLYFLLSLERAARRVRQ